MKKFDTACIFVHRKKLVLEDFEQARIRRMLHTMMDGHLEYTFFKAQLEYRKLHPSQHCS